MPLPYFNAGDTLLASQLNAMVDAINAGGAVKVATFTSSGTWTVPTGVTYAVAHIRGGGGASSLSGATAGGSSSVAFASGTVSAGGGGATNNGIGTPTGSPGVANSGNGARAEYIWGGAAYTQLGANNPQDGGFIVAGAAVTAGASITVTVGAGGTGTIAGGSGLVYIEYTGG